MADATGFNPLSAVEAPGPALRAAAVTKSDSTTFAQRTRGLYVGTGGDVAVRMSNGDSVTFPSVPSGYILPVSVDRVLSTGTTASGIVRLW